MAKKFSLETVLSLTDGITAPIKKAEAKMVGFSKNIKKHFGGFGKDIMKVDKALNKGIAVAGAAAFAALGAAIVVATKQYIEFEQAIVQAGALPLSYPGKSGTGDWPRSSSRSWLANLTI